MDPRVFDMWCTMNKEAMHIQSNLRTHEAESSKLDVGKSKDRDDAPEAESSKPDVGKSKDRDDAPEAESSKPDVGKSKDRDDAPKNKEDELCAIGGEVKDDKSKLLVQKGT